MIVAKSIARVDRHRPIEVTNQVHPEATVRQFCPFLWLTGGKQRNSQIDGDNLLVLEGLDGVDRDGAVFQPPWLGCSGAGWLDLR